MDTGLYDAAFELADGADMGVCESTFADTEAALARCLSPRSIRTPRLLVVLAAGVAAEASECGLRLLGVKAVGDATFVDGGAGGAGAVVVQMAVASGPG